MKEVFEIGDRLKVKDKFGSSDWAEDIRELAGTLVTVRDITDNGDFCWIKETEGLKCDELWAIDDFEIDE